MPDEVGSARAPRAELTRRIDAVEEAYEFMLAYAAQGLSGDAAARSNGELRQLLTAAVVALHEIPPLASTVATVDRPQCAGQFAAFQEVLDRDARASLAAIELVLAQPSISSQLIDNLNASIHLRALLTDLFLLDEILK